MGKKVLIVSTFDIYPADAGNKLRIISVSEQLKKMGLQVHFLIFGVGIKVHEATAQLYEGNVFVANSSATTFSASVIFKVSTARKLVCTFFARLKILLEFGLTSFRFNKPLRHYQYSHHSAFIKEHTSKNSYDVVIVNYAINAYLLRLFPRSTLKIIDTHDVLTDRFKEYVQQGLKPTDWYSLTPKEEREALSEADVVWAITQEDQLFFERLFFSTRSPRIVEVGYLTKINRLEPSQSQDILFVGSGNPINFHGINWFIESIWKDLKQQCPDAQLLIAGSICDEKEKIRSLSGIFFLGRLQHVEEAYAQADICINPMQMGTGLKIKSVEALSFGKVLLTTSAGATGIRHLNDSHFFCSDESGEWRKELVEILGGTKKRSMYMIKSVEIVESLNSLAKRNMALSL